MAVSLPDKHSDLDLSSDSLDRSYDIINDEETGIAIGSTIVCRVCFTLNYNTNNFRQNARSYSVLIAIPLWGLNIDAAKCHQDISEELPRFKIQHKRGVIAFGVQIRLLQKLFKSMINFTL